MSEQGSNEQVPVPPVPQAGYPQPGYSQPGYPPQYAAMPVKPPRPALTVRQRRGAMIAGGVGFALFQIGSTILTFLAVLGVFILVLGVIARSDGGADSMREAINLANELDATAIIVAVIAAIVVGILALTFGILTSRWIMKSHGVNRPTAVTWSALGVGVVANWVLSGIIGQALNAARLFPGIGIPVMFGILTILGSVAIGVFAWWWMAHLFRARELAQPGFTDTASARPLV